MGWKLISQYDHEEYPDIRRQMYRAAAHEDMSPDQIAEHMESDHHQEMPLSETVMDFLVSNYEKAKEAKGRDKAAYSSAVRSVFAAMADLRDRLVQAHATGTHSATEHSHPGMDSEEGRAAQARLEEFRQRGRTEPLSEEDKRFF